MVRIATYNVENLFERSAILNGVDSARNQQLLNQVAELESLLGQAQYDKARILSLYQGLTDYIEIREDRGKLFKRRGFAVTAVVANGRSDWDGGIAFKAEKFSDQTRGNTAKVIREVRADILALIEVEGRQAIDNFRYNLLASMRYQTNLSIEGNDPRGIDVGFLSKFPFTDINTHVFDKRGNSRVFSRDCLRVAFDVGGTPVHLLINHFKSKGYGSQNTSDARRRGQAERVREILEENYDLDRDLVVVCGDLNDTPSSNPLHPLLSLAGLHDVLELGGLPLADRWTYHYRGGNQIDFLLVSSALRQRFRAVGVERRGIYNLHKLTQGAAASFDTVTGPRNAASDHGAVWADFDI